MLEVTSHIAPSAVDSSKPVLSREVMCVQPGSTSQPLLTRLLTAQTQSTSWQALERLASGEAAARD